MLGELGKFWNLCEVAGTTEFRGSLETADAEEVVEKETVGGGKRALWRGLAGKIAISGFYLETWDQRWAADGFAGSVAGEAELKLAF